LIHGEHHACLTSAVDSLVLLPQTRIYILVCVIVV